jgi:hypothetical protein
MKLIRCDRCYKEVPNATSTLQLRDANGTTLFVAEVCLDCTIRMHKLLIDRIPHGLYENVTGR